MLSRSHISSAPDQTRESFIRPHGAYCIPPAARSHRIGPQRSPRGDAHHPHPARKRTGRAPHCQSAEPTRSRAGAQPAWSSVVACIRSAPGGKESCHAVDKKLHLTRARIVAGDPSLGAGACGGGVRAPVHAVLDTWPPQSVAPPAILEAEHLHQGAHPVSGKFESHPSQMVHLGRVVGGGPPPPPSQMDIEWRGRHKLAIPDGKREKSIWDPRCPRSIWVANSA